MIHENRGQIETHGMKLYSVTYSTWNNAFSDLDRDDYESVPEDMDEYGRQVLRRIGADDEIIATIDG